MTQSTKKLYRSLTTESVAFVVGTHRHMGGRFQEMRIGPSIIWGVFLCSCCLLVSGSKNPKLPKLERHSTSESNQPTNLGLH